MGHLPTQTVPFPVNPSLQVQVYDPSLFKQSAFSSHGLPFLEHSSISKTKTDNNMINIIPLAKISKGKA